jgi:hypothetical protein
MLFEPETLLCLARKSGLNLYRRGGLIIIESQSGDGIPKAWTDVLKHHKPDLLPLLSNMPATLRRPARPAVEVRPGDACDLFGPIPPQPGHKPQTRQARSAWR